MVKIGRAGMKINKKVFFVLAFLAYLPSVYACPMCTELIEHGKGAFMAMRFGQGIAWSIVLLLAVPFSMVGTMVFVIYRANQRKTSSALSDNGHDGKA